MLRHEHGVGLRQPRVAVNAPLIELGFNGPRLCCTVAPKIARVEARFQDGARVSLVPKQGYLVWPIRAEHYALGHRLVALLGFDSAGRAIARGKLPTPADQRGIYPCKTPKSLGYGVKAVRVARDEGPNLVRRRRTRFPSYALRTATTSRTASALLPSAACSASSRSTSRICSIPFEPSFTGTPM